VIWPVGPLPPGVYWRRRLLVLGALFAVVFLVWFAFLRGSGSDAGPPPQPTPTVEPTEPTSGPTTPPPAPSPTRTDDLCLDSDILVEASAEFPIYPVGSTPTLSLIITNIGTVECRRNVGPGANELWIEQSGVRLWSSDDCNPSQAADIISLKRGEEFITQLTWDGRKSAVGCPSDQPIVDAGEYQVLGRNSDVRSLPSGLRLE
jgi:hypothetical protein